jgi:hypothetical protein
LLNQQKVLFSRKRLLPSNKRFQLGSKGLVSSRNEVQPNSKEVLLGCEQVWLGSKRLLPSNKEVLLHRERMLSSRNCVWSSCKEVFPTCGRVKARPIPPQLD